MRAKHCTPVLVQGAQTSDVLLFVREAADVGIEHRWVTEDGTSGQRGLVTDALAGLLTDLDTPPVEILACGPPAMLSAVARMALQNAIPCQVSLEERMACGFGICMGCAVEQVTPGTSERDFALVCVDGPVFDAPTVFPQSE
jgi:dihydroorotate dehydrogenase electron transfer subunit